MRLDPRAPSDRSGLASAREVRKFSTGGRNRIQQKPGKGADRPAKSRRHSASGRRFGVSRSLEAYES